MNARGEFWYEISSERLDATRLVELLRHFMHRRGRVFLVLDGHPAHVAHFVSEYVQSLRGALELHFLPGYFRDMRLNCIPMSLSRTT